MYIAYPSPLPTMQDKSLGTIVALPPPPPPIIMLIFSGSEKADASIDGWNISTLSGGKGVLKDAVYEKHSFLL